MRARFYFANSQLYTKAGNEKQESRYFETLHLQRSWKRIFRENIYGRKIAHRFGEETISIIIHEFIIHQIHLQIVLILLIKVHFRLLRKPLSGSVFWHHHTSSETTLAINSWTELHGQSFMHRRFPESGRIEAEDGQAARADRPKLRPIYEVLPEPEQWYG